MVVSVIANLSLSDEYRGRLTFTSTGKLSQKRCAPAKAGAYLRKVPF
jgi:hypothetical protein